MIKVRRLADRCPAGPPSTREFDTRGGLHFCDWLWYLEDGMRDTPAKTDEQWREMLTPEQFAVARKGGTERAFTGEYWQTKEPGRYVCVCCGEPLFGSQDKYDSGSGWPSYVRPLNADAVESISDRSHGMVRTEVRCARCGAHLGHVFSDGPAPTGQRYCINSASLKLIPDVDTKE